MRIVISLFTCVRLLTIARVWVVGFAIHSSLLFIMGGGAWPFLVGGVICHVNSVNERILTCNPGYVGNFLAGVCVSDAKKLEANTARKLVALVLIPKLTHNAAR